MDQQLINNEKGIKDDYKKRIQMVDRYVTSMNPNFNFMTAQTAEN